MLDKFQMSIEDNISFAKRELVDSIYKEASIEGINVTFPETQQIFDGFAIDSFSFEDTTKIINLKHAWYFILDTLEYPLDVRYLRHINALIQRNLIGNPGMIREIGVRISGTSWMPEIPTIALIEKELERIKKIENPTERSIELLLSIMRGQYFEDGNKRTAQLIANHEMIRNGCGIISIPIEEKIRFGQLLIRYYETNDKKEISSFIFERCISGYARERYVSKEELERQKIEDEKEIKKFMDNLKKESTNKSDIL